MVAPYSRKISLGASMYLQKYWSRTAPSVRTQLVVKVVRCWSMAVVLTALRIAPSYSTKHKALARVGDSTPTAVRYKSATPLSLRIILTTVRTTRLTVEAERFLQEATTSTATAPA